MFSGLVETVGIVRTVSHRGNYRAFLIATDISRQLREGDSIACDGACLTVVTHDQDEFTVEASQETLMLTIAKGYQAGSRVNLERSLAADGRFGGHFVTGHVDGTAEVLRFQRVGESWELVVRYEKQLDPWIVPKGSVALNGVSLTVNEVRSGELSVNLIPYTISHTTLSGLRPGSQLNIECDLIGKYVAKQIGSKEDSPITLASLRKSGW